MTSLGAFSAFLTANMLFICHHFSGSVVMINSGSMSCVYRAGERYGERQDDDRKEANEIHALHLHGVNVVLQIADLLHAVAVRQCS